MTERLTLIGAIGGALWAIGVLIGGEFVLWASVLIACGAILGAIIASFLLEWRPDR